MSEFAPSYMPPPVQPPPKSGGAYRLAMLVILVAMVAVVVLLAVLVFRPSSDPSGSAAASAPVATTQAYRPQPAPVPAPTVNVDQAFLLEIHRAGLNTMGSDSSQLELAATVCDAWRAGMTFEDMLDVLVRSGYSYAEAGSFIGLATAAYCSQYGSRIGG